MYTIHSQHGEFSSSLLSVVAASFHQVALLFSVCQSLAQHHGLHMGEDEFGGDPSLCGGCEEGLGMVRGGQ